MKIAPGFNRGLASALWTGTPRSNSLTNTSRMCLFPSPGTLRFFVSDINHNHQRSGRDREAVGLYISTTYEEIRMACDACRYEPFGELRH
jgi:hypothetical protein